MRADERLHLTLTRARSASLVEFELVALAALAVTQEHAADARARLDDVWEAAERGPYPLIQADAYNVLAELERQVNHIDAAVQAATNAYRAAWCDGPPHTYRWGLETATAHLAALGAPAPDTPSFDESAFEPMPEVEINPRDENYWDPESGLALPD